MESGVGKVSIGKWKIAIVPFVAVYILVSVVVLAGLHSAFALVSWKVSDAFVEMRSGPIALYIVDLDGVGGVRAANHSAVVDGATQATFINMRHKLSFPVYISDRAIPDYDVNVYVNVSYEVVRDWPAYRQIVEKANNTIIVNTHDKILPVPEGYTKEKWIAVIADFMLNRWGTWVHTGGLPFHVVRYENGTTKEWNQGFQQLLENANLNITIQNPPKENLLIDFGRDADSYLGQWGVKIDYEFGNHSISLSNFFEVSTENCYCIKRTSQDSLKLLLEIYALPQTENGALNWYNPSVAIELSNSTDRYGVFVYMSPWTFYDVASNMFTDNHANGIAMGAIPTAAAIWCEAGYAAKNIVEANAATQKDENMLQKAVEMFNFGNFKQAIIFAEKAKTATPSQLNVLLICIPIAITAFIITTTAIHYCNSKNERKGKEAK